MKEIAFMLSFLMYTFTTLMFYSGAGSDVSPAVSIQDKPPSSAWEEQIDQIANNQQSPKEKAAAVEKLAKEYVPTTEELEEFKVYVLNEFLNLRYLDDSSDDKYMLSGIFQAIALKHHDLDRLRDLAEAFYHNTKNVYTGVTKPGSDSVLKYEEQMFESINAGR
ncbi:hypothetical protein ABIE27_004177 [Paenibacillus sp. 4624]|uniref:hypothetical protein n=1 Tax=Paenibacillus sp. 4624 TaxID=3156453 RepID=UPI003D1ADB34